MDKRLVTAACFGVNNGSPVVFAVHSVVVEYGLFKKTLDEMVKELSNCSCETIDDEKRGVCRFRTVQREPYGLELYTCWLPVRQDGSLEKEDSWLLPKNVNLLPEDEFFRYLSDTKKFISEFREEMWTNNGNSYHLCS
ncbi:hypothetical protein IKF20_00375 [Candidatus Saccharibacteria bacterium]|nr:hypothetical protein [Candidatus Saccharibacteria bacterium]